MKKESDNKKAAVPEHGIAAEIFEIGVFEISGRNNAGLKQAFIYK